MRGILAIGFAMALTGAATAADADQQPVYVMRVAPVDNCMMVARENREVWVIDIGAGCPALWLYKKKWVILNSSGMFAGIGSDLILPNDGQQCPIWNARLME